MNASNSSIKSSVVTLSVTGGFLMHRLLTVIVMMLLFSPLAARNVAGTWHDARIQATMVLHADGTYQLQYPNGSSQGRYTANGNNFCLYHQSGAAAVCYTVTGYNGNQMMLQDANGVMLNYVRQQQQQSPTLPGGGVQPQAAPQPATPPQAPTAGGGVLAQKGNFTLTSNHLEIGVNLTQFIIGQAVKPSERNELRLKLIEEFNAMPQQALQQIDGLGQSMQKIRSLTNAVQIGYARQQLFAALYKATYQMQEYQKPLLIQVINRYIKVLAFDPANNLVMTDKDALGLMKYLAFNSELMGQKIEISQQLYQSTVAEMVQKFQTMPLQQKQVLCSSGLLWQYVEYCWNQLSPAQKKQYQTQFLAQVQAQNPNYQQYQTQPDYSSQQYQQQYQQYQQQYQQQGQTKKSPAEMMRDFNSRQQLYNMMSNMSTMSHVTSLNIIENMGDSGGYWKMTDY